MKVPKTRLAVPASPLLPSERFIYFVNPQNTGAGLLRPESLAGTEFGFTY